MYDQTTIYALSRLTQRAPLKEPTKNSSNGFNTWKPRRKKTASLLTTWPWRRWMCIRMRRRRIL